MTDQLPADITAAIEALDKAAFAHGYEFAGASDPEGEAGLIADAARAALEAAILKLADENDRGWRPIETAPKDGSWCVFTSTWNKYARGCAQWIDGGWMDANDDPGDQTSYTHWMPLPDPPASAD